MKRRTRREGVRIRTFFMDEARFGQQGTLTRVWAAKGSRPRAVKQTKYEWVYLFAAVEPETGASTALLAPRVNTPTMNVFLEMLSSDLGPRDHAVVIMDRAGWHVSKSLAVPSNITLLLLPPYSPELNPVENLWHWIKSHHTSNRVFADYDDLIEGVGDAWRSLAKERLSSVCRCDYLGDEEERQCVLGTDAANCFRHCGYTLREGWGCSNTHEIITVCVTFYGEKSLFHGCC